MCQRITWPESSACQQVINPSITVASFPPISEFLVAASHQINDYLRQGKQPELPIEAEPAARVKSITASITAKTFRPATLRVHRSADEASKQIFHPSKWVTDRTTLAHDLEVYLHQAQEYTQTPFFLEWSAKNPDPQAHRSILLEALTDPSASHDPRASEGGKPSTGNTPEPDDGPHAPKAQRFREGIFPPPNFNESVLQSIESQDPPAVSDVASIVAQLFKPPQKQASSGPSDSDSRKLTSINPTSQSSSMGTTNWQDSGFSEQQWNALQALINNARTPGPTGPAGPAGPSGPSGPAGASSSGGSDNKWNASEVGFFDPRYDGKSVVTGSPIEHTGKDTYFRDVHVFVERIKDMVVIKGDKMMRDNLYTCLRGAALEWYTAILTDEQKRLVKLGDGVDEWVHALTKKWKESPTAAVAIVSKERYTMDDARRKREPFEYVQIIVRAAKSAEMSTYTQIYFIYNGMEPEFRRDLTKPTMDTTMDAFVQQMDDTKEIWWDIASKNRFGGHQAPYRNNVDVRPQQGQYSNAGFSTGFRTGGGYQTSSNSLLQQRPYQTQFPSSYQFRNAGFQPQQNRAYQPQQQQQPRQLMPAPQGYPNRQLQPAPSGQNQQFNIPGLQSRSGSGFQQQQPRQGGYQPFRPNANAQAGRWQTSSGYRPNYTSSNPNFTGNRQFVPQPPRVYFGDEQGVINDEPDENRDPQDHDEGYQGEHWPDEAQHDEAPDGPSDYRQPQDDTPGFHDPPGAYDITGHFVTSMKQEQVYQCRRCRLEFYSNNKLHKHLRSCRSKEVPQDAIQETFHGSTGPTIQSDAKQDDPTGAGFRTYKHASVSASTADDATRLNDHCADSGCPGSMVDREFLAIEVPDYRQKSSPRTPLNVRGIGNAMVTSTEHLPLTFKVPGTVNGKPAVACFTRMVNIVDGLKAKMLIGNDILCPERITLNMGQELMIIGSCQNLVAKLTVTHKGIPVRRVARATGLVKVPARSSTMVAFKLRGKSTLPAGRDYMFTPQAIDSLGPDGGVMAHIIDANTAFVEVRNASNDEAVLPKNCKLGMVQDYEEEGCYMALPEDAYLAAGRPKPKQQNWVRKAIAAGAIAMTALNGLMTASNMATAGTTAIEAPAAEATTTNGITIYGNEPQTQAALAAVTEAYPRLWCDDGTPVSVPEHEWMPITLKPDAKIEAAKVYPLGLTDRQLVDDTFDKLHEQGRMEYTSQPTPHGYPVFVVWRTVGTERKGRVVVDIRGLNKIAVTDTYPMPLQSDITAAVAGCQYITVVDAASFFHQWRVKADDRHKLTVVSHRGQEQFNVAVMGFKNSPPYVQRRIDTLLRDMRKFARAYVDDIVIFSQTLDEHINHLHQIFGLLDSFNVSLSPKKSFIGYPTVALLGQKVDAFGLTTAADKLEAIAKLDFPYTLKELETYLGLTGWLRYFVAWYAQKSNPLQQRKTVLLRMSPSSKGTARRIYSRRTVVENPSEAELESYRQLQEAFSQARFLVHFDANRILFIDIDASKKRGFGAMVYHLKATCQDPNKPKRTDIEPIMFLSRMLNAAEAKYWPTELEMAGLVWVTKRVRHMVDAAKHTTVIFTDHAANTSIARQTTLTTSNTDKLNLRLVRASTYLSQFNLDIKYRPGKDHIIPDALSRLSSGCGLARQTSDALDIDIDSYHSSMTDPSDPINDSYAYQGSLIAMSDEFKQRVIAGYAEETAWQDIIEMLKELAERVQDEEAPTPADQRGTAEDAHPAIEADPNQSDEAPPATPAEPEATAAEYPTTGIDFELAPDGLLYHIGGPHRRLCLPKSVEKDIFHLAHDDNQHSGIHRSYARIAESLYVPRLSRKLRKYIEHCPTCQLVQTKRHRPYGELMPIGIPPKPFHTIAIDFFGSLPGDLSSVMSVTCKFSRRVTLIAGKSTYTASQWANALLDRLLIADWGIPEAIVSDRDPKFLSDMWKTLFDRLGTSLLMSTAYHPQTDGASERTNQTVEIAIRFLVTEYPDINWVLALPSLQAQLNNAPNVATGLSPNEIIYGFKVRDTLSALAPRNERHDFDMAAQRLEYRQEAADATAFANAKAKIYYDARHQPLLLRQGDSAYIILHHGYQLPGRPNRKVSPQRCGPFKVVRRVGRLAYKLEIPHSWKQRRIHPVFSVAQLEPAPSEEDPYHRPRPTEPGPIDMEDDSNHDETFRSYEVEKVVDKRVRRYGRTNVTQYLVRWLGYGPEHDEWKSLTALSFCLDLIEDYEAAHRTTAAIGPYGRRNPHRNARQPAASNAPVATNAPNASNLPVASTPVARPTQATHNEAPRPIQRFRGVMIPVRQASWALMV